MAAMGVEGGVDGRVKAWRVHGAWRSPSTAAVALFVCGVQDQKARITDGIVFLF
jgi:hypothetical protein